MIFPSCPSLIYPKACSALLNPFAWAGSGIALLSWANSGWNLEIHPLLGGTSKPPWELLRWFGLLKDIAFSLIQEGNGVFFCEAGIFFRFIAKPGAGGWQAAQLLSFTLHREPGGRLFSVPWLPQNSSACGGSALCNKKQNIIKQNSHLPCLAQPSTQNVLEACSNSCYLLLGSCVPDLVLSAWCY